jgi:hypothetical protein
VPKGLAHPNKSNTQKNVYQANFSWEESNVEMLGLAATERSVAVLKAEVAHILPALPRTHL